MRSVGRTALTIAGVLALLACAGAVVKGVDAWTSPQTRCVTEQRPGADAFCARTVPVSGLAKVPWTYVGVALALLLLAVCLFTLRERVRAES
ncbi:MAG TPA: hypothetical protein VGH79_09795 [Gaiellaceae bacterium]|jgi:hypothetical protein